MWSLNSTYSDLVELSVFLWPCDFDMFKKLNLTNVDLKQNWFPYTLFVVLVIQEVYEVHMFCIQEMTDFIGDEDKSWPFSFQTDRWSL